MRCATTLPEHQRPAHKWEALAVSGQMVDNQGEAHDGGMFDDPTDDIPLEKLKSGASDALWAWGPALLKYNPPALLFQGVAGAAEAGAEAASAPLKEVAQIAKALIIGATATGAAALLVYIYNRSRARLVGTIEAS